MTRVLVAYASKYGSVAEVARYVGAVLRDQDVDCRVVDVADVQDLPEYDFVVLGTGLYMGRLHRGARRFLRRHHEELAQIPFAVFALGPLSDEPAEKEEVRPQLERGLAHYPGLAPVASEIFGGVIDPDRMPFPFNRMPAGDHRDWDEIRNFAVSLPLPVAVTA